MPSSAYYSGPESPPNAVLHGQVLEAKYLGLEIGHNLNWNQHIQNVTTKTNWTYSFKRRNIQTKHKGICQAAFNTIVRPRVEYASPVWSPYTQTNINKVEAVQRRAARWVTNDYSSCSSVTQMINTLGWRSLDARLIMLYKIVHVYGLVEISFTPYIQRQVKMTRNVHPYHLIQIHTSANYYKYSFFPLAIVQWNNLPSSAVLSDALTTFRSIICSLHHIMPCRESLFLSAFKLLLLPHTNTILASTKVILIFFYHTFLGACSGTWSLREGIAGHIEREFFLSFFVLESF